MAEIALRTYLEDIERLMGRELYDEAIAHCRHILTIFPLNVDAYRLLGKALLEKSQFVDAADVFQRVLSADPSDFVAHVGLAIIREEDGVLDQAIWHMERAYELQPNNTAILDELRRLYGKRDGREPGRIGLTRTALARLYIQGELYEQAITELQAALAEDPERMDIQVLLAEVYWRDEQPTLAAARCRAILARLPNCISANAIMAQIALANEDESEASGAQLYLELLRALAPYRVAEIQPGVEFEEPRVERLQVQSSAPAAQPYDEGPDWVRELAASFATGHGAESAVPAPAQEAPAASPEEELPDWLREMAALLPGVSETQVAPEPQTTAEAPSPEPPPEPVAEPPPKRTSPLQEVLAATGPLIGAVEPPLTTPLSQGVQDEETPDWLRQAMDEIPDFAEVERIEAGTTATLESWTPPTGELPDWLRDAAAEGESVPLSDETSQQIAAATLPEWLQRPAEPVMEAEAPAISLAEAEVEQAAEAEGETPAPVESQAPEVAETALAWLDQIAEQAEGNGAEAPDTVVEMPEWLREPAPAPEAGETPEPMPDWLSEALSVSPMDGMMAEPAPALEAPPVDIQRSEEMAAATATATPGEALTVEAVDLVPEAAPEMPTPEMLAAEPAPEVEAAVSTLVEMAQPAGPEAQLELARSHFHEGNWESAAELYDQLIADAALLAEVIADLEDAVTLHATHRWYTLLGDAYSQDGQLKKAMQAYQTALKSLHTKELQTK